MEAGGKDVEVFLVHLVEKVSGDGAHFGAKLKLATEFNHLRPCIIPANLGDHFRVAGQRACRHRWLLRREA